MFLRIVATLALWSPLAQAQMPADIPRLDFVAKLDANASRLTIAWTNGGTSPFLLTLGSIANDLMPTIRLSITGIGIEAGDLVDATQPPGIAGRIENMVVCLPVRTSYSLEFPTDN